MQGHKAPKSPGKRRTRWLRLLAITLAGIIVVLVAIWMTFQHIPDWYQPVALDDAGVLQAKADAAAMAEYVSDELVGGQSFEVILDDLTVNEWLAAMPESMPDVWRRVPDEFSDPAVQFEDGLVQLGALYRERGWAVLVNLALSLDLSPDGQMVVITLQRVRGGSLGVPRSVLERGLAPLLRRARSARPSDDPELRSLHSALRRVKTVDDLFEGVSIPNRFRWPNGNRWFAITKITIDDGEMRLDLEPL